VKKFLKRHGKTLIEKGFFRVKEFDKNNEPIKEPIYPYHTGSAPTKIKISKSLLTHEGSYGLNRIGYFSVIPHEAVHASPEVKNHPRFEPFSQIHSRGPGHDNIHNKKN